MKSARRPRRAEDELTDDVITAAVFGLTASALGVRLAGHDDGSSVLVGVALGVAAGAVSTMLDRRHSRRRLRETPVLPLPVVFMHPGLQLLRAVAVAVLICLFAVEDPDFGPSFALFMSVTFTCTSVCAAVRLHTSRSPGERFVRLRDWAYADKVFRLPAVDVTRAEEAQTDGSRR